MWNPDYEAINQEQVNMKHCSMCDTKKHFEEFNKDRTKKSGLASLCKKCTGIVGKKWAQNNKGKTVNSSLKWQKNNPDKVAEIQARYKNNNPEKISERRRLGKKEKPLQNRAHVAVYNAVKSDKLVKPLNCSKCGTDKNIQAHHHDYSKPLDVIWLCGKCHKAMHPIERKNVA